MQDKGVRSRLQASGQIPGLHAALRDISKRGDGDENLGKGSGDTGHLAQSPGARVPGAVSSPKEQALQGAVLGSASGKMDARSYLGSRQQPRDMTMKAYNRDIDKHMRQIKTRPIVDLRGTIPSLAQMGWAEPEMATRHHEPAPETKLDPAISLSTSSSSSGSEISVVRAIKRHGHNMGSPGASRSRS